VALSPAGGSANPRRSLLQSRPDRSPCLYAFGVAPAWLLDRAGTNMVFQLASCRHERSSMIISLSKGYRRMWPRPRRRGARYRHPRPLPPTTASHHPQRPQLPPQDRLTFVAAGGELMPRSIPPKPPREVVRDRHVRSYPPTSALRTSAPPSSGTVVPIQPGAEMPVA
jgi:hypothetical protein